MGAAGAAADDWDMPDTYPPAQPGSDGSIAELQRDIDSVKVRRDSLNVVTFVVAALALLGRVIGVGFAAAADSGDSAGGAAARGEIGRASCTESVCQYVLISVSSVSLKKTHFYLLSPLFS